MNPQNLYGSDHKLIGLLALRQQRPLLLLLVLHEGLDVHVEAVAGGALGGLGGQLALLEQQRQQREQGVFVDLSFISFELRLVRGIREVRR